MEEFKKFKYYIYNGTLEIEEKYNRIRTIIKSNKIRLVKELYLNCEDEEIWSQLDEELHDFNFYFFEDILDVIDNSTNILEEDKNELRIECEVIQCMFYIGLGLFNKMWDTLDTKKEPINLREVTINDIVDIAEIYEIMLHIQYKLRKLINRFSKEDLEEVNEAVEYSFECFDNAIRIVLYIMFQNTFIDKKEEEVYLANTYIDIINSVSLFINPDKEIDFTTKKPKLK